MERGGIRKEGEKEKSRKGKSGRRDTMEEEEREGGVGKNHKKELE